MNYEFEVLPSCGFAEQRAWLEVRPIGLLSHLELKVFKAKSGAAVPGSSHPCEKLVPAAEARVGEGLKIQSRAAGN